MGSPKLIVRIEQIEEGESISTEETEYFQQTIIHKIDKNELEDGDYKVQILVGDEKELFICPICNEKVYDIIYT